MDLNKIRELAISLMRQHGLTEWTFKWGDFVGVFGKCDYHNKHILLSRKMTQHETNHDRVVNTILHEIAHALDHNIRGFSNHDKHWQKLAKSIGCSGTRCGNPSGLNKGEYMKWIGTCPNCKRNYYRNIKPKNVLSCSDCHPGEYNPDYKIDWEFNPKLKTWEQFTMGI